MYVKELTYTDFDGNQVTETLRFAYTKADIVELEITHEGGMQAYLNSIVTANDSKQLIALFKELLISTVGVKTANGKFLKTDAVREDFMASNAYSEMFIMLATNAEEAAKFCTQIMPDDMINEAKSQGLMNADGTLTDKAKALGAAQSANTTPIS